MCVCVCVYVYVYITSNLNPLTKFTAISRSTEF